jgi:hypothetical protein
MTGGDVESVFDDTKGGYFSSFLTSSKWRKRGKWLLIQTVLLLIKMGQAEFYRWTIRRAAEKRLAVIPEFPLL